RHTPCAPPFAAASNSKRDVPTAYHTAAPCSLLPRFRKIGGELFERAAPTLAHAVVAGIEGFLLHFCGVVGRPADGEPGLSVRKLLEREDGQHLQRPARTHRMP